MDSEMDASGNINTDLKHDVAIPQSLPPTLHNIGSEDTALPNDLEHLLQEYSSGLPAIVTVADLSKKFDYFCKKLTPVNYNNLKECKQELEYFLSSKPMIDFQLSYDRFKMLKIHPEYAGIMHKHSNEDKEQKTAEFLKDQLIFTENTRLKINERERVEFKFYFKPSQHEKEIKKIICSFLNGKGGRLYIGINDDGVVMGVSLTKGQREELETKIDQYIDSFYPSVHSKVNILYIEVQNINEEIIAGRYIIKIVVERGDPGTLYSINKQTGAVYTRIDNRIKALPFADWLTTLKKREKCSDKDDDDLYNDAQPDLKGGSCFEVQINLISGLKLEDLIKFFSLIEYQTKNNRSHQELYGYYSRTQTIYKKYSNEADAMAYRKLLIERIKLKQIDTKKYFPKDYSIEKAIVLIK